MSAATTEGVGTVGGGVAASVDGAVPASSRLTFRGPRRSDPRLHVASILLTVQLLGQTVIRWDLSVAQLLVSLGTAAAVELAFTVPRTRVVAWPASALLTGNGIALIMRVPGTEHGDWWSLRGWYVFAATAALAVLSKYVIRVGDRPLFNPSNLGLVVAFLVLGSGIADPQDLWWGHPGPGLAATYALILAGGLILTRRLRLFAISAVFWPVFATFVGLASMLGHSMSARWSLDPVAGWDYWTTVVLSPEVLIFVFFMITDPRTAAQGRTASVVYAGAVGAASGVLVAFQTTEYATKVALLTGLVAVCAVRPWIERITAAGNTGADGGVRWWRADARRPLVAVGLLAASLSIAGLVAGGGPEAVVAASPSPTTPVALRADQRPSVTLGDGFDSVGGTFVQPDAERVALQVVRAVLALDEAVAEGDTATVADLAGGALRRSLETGPPVAAPDRTFDTAVVDVVRDPGEFQAVPRILVTFSGSIDGEPVEVSYHVLATEASVRLERLVVG